MCVLKSDWSKEMETAKANLIVKQSDDILMLQLLQRGVEIGFSQRCS